MFKKFVLFTMIYGTTIVINNINHHLFYADIKSAEEIMLLSWVVFYMALKTIEEKE